MNFANMTSAHFIFIPAVLLIGVVIGWILGARAARDAFAMELKRREERGARGGKGTSWCNAELACVRWTSRRRRSVFPGKSRAACGSRPASA